MVLRSDFNNIGGDTFIYFFIHFIMLYSLLLSLSSFLFFSLFPTFVHARSQNISIDDQYGDPTNGQTITYTPSGAWSVGQTCGNDNNSNCAASPSPSQSAFMATWMEGVMNSTSNNNDSSSDQPVSASVPFLGRSLFFHTGHTYQRRLCTTSG